MQHHIVCGAPNPKVIKDWKVRAHHALGACTALAVRIGFPLVVVEHGDRLRRPRAHQGIVGVGARPTQSSKRADPTGRSNVVWSAKAPWDHIDLVIDDYEQPRVVLPNRGQNAEEQKRNVFNLKAAGVFTARLPVC